jgi:septal ring factor EnvC (AmiA/AmiB activator)
VVGAGDKQRDADRIRRGREERKREERERERRKKPAPVKLGLSRTNQTGATESRCLLWWPHSASRMGRQLRHNSQRDSDTPNHLA